MLEHSRQVSYQISRSPQEKFEFNGLRTEDGYSSGFWRFDALSEWLGSGTKSPESKATPIEDRSVENRSTLPGGAVRP
jgi:hypothetical protein